MGSLIVDRREPFELVDVLRERTDYDISGEQLKTGDVISRDLSAAVERKTMNDAVESCGNGRLFEQAERISEEFDHGCVVITGQTIHPIRADCHNGFAGSVRTVMGAAAYINQEYPNVHATMLPGDETAATDWGLIQFVEYVDRWFRQLQ